MRISYKRKGLHGNGLQICHIYAEKKGRKRKNTRNTRPRNETIQFFPRSFLSGFRFLSRFTLVVTLHCHAEEAWRCNRISFFIALKQWRRIFRKIYRVLAGWAINFIFFAHIMNCPRDAITNSSTWTCEANFGVFLEKILFLSSRIGV